MRKKVQESLEKIFEYLEQWARIPTQVINRFLCISEANASEMGLKMKTNRHALGAPLGRAESSQCRVWVQLNIDGENNGIHS